MVIPDCAILTGKNLPTESSEQWVENHHLYVVITYKFPDGELREEKARFRQDPELIQEQWSWKELKDRKAATRIRRGFSLGNC